MSIRFTDEFESDKLVSFSRLVMATPMGEGANCCFQEDIHLLFHHIYGNWHAWRFALIFEDVEILS